MTTGPESLHGTLKHWGVTYTPAQSHGRAAGRLGARSRGYPVTEDGDGAHGSASKSPLALAVDRQRKNLTTADGPSQDYSTIRSLQGVGSMVTCRGLASVVKETMAWPGASDGKRSHSDSSIPVHLENSVLLANKALTALSLVALLPTLVANQQLWRPVI